MTSGMDLPPRDTLEDLARNSLGWDRARARQTRVVDLRAALAAAGGGSRKEEEEDSKEDPSGKKETIVSILHPGSRCSRDGAGAGDDEDDRLTEIGDPPPRSDGGCTGASTTTTTTPPLPRPPPPVPRRRIVVGDVLASGGIGPLEDLCRQLVTSTGETVRRRDLVEEEQKRIGTERRPGASPSGGDLAVDIALEDLSAQVARRLRKLRRIADKVSVHVQERLKARGELLGLLRQLRSPDLGCPEFVDVEEERDVGGVGGVGAEDDRYPAGEGGDLDPALALLDDEVARLGSLAVLLRTGDDVVAAAAAAEEDAGPVLSRATAH